MALFVWAWASGTGAVLEVAETDRGATVVLLLEPQRCRDNSAWAVVDANESEAD